MEEKSNKIMVSLKTKKRDETKLFMSEELSDVAFVIGERRFPAHKAVLAMESQYFRRMFQSGMREATEKLIQLQLDEEDADIFYFILKFIYTRTLNDPMTVKQITRLVSMAFEYVMVDQTMAADLERLIIGQCLSMDTVFQCLEIADLYNMLDLSHESLALFDFYGSHLVTMEEFHKLKPELIVKILRNRPAVLTPMDIFEVVRQQMSRESVAENLLTRNAMAKCVPLPEISAKDYLEIIKPSGIYSGLPFDNDYFDAFFTDGQKDRGKIHYPTNTVCQECKIRTPKRMADGNLKYEMIKLSNCGHQICLDCLLELNGEATCDVDCPSAGCGITIRSSDIAACYSHARKSADVGGHHLFEEYPFKTRNFRHAKRRRE